MMFQPNVSEFVKVWTEHTKYMTYMLVTEFNYVTALKRARNFDGLLKLVALLDTIVLAIYFGMIISKVAFLSRDRLYRQIFMRLSRGEEISYRLRPTRNNWHWPWKETMIVIAILMLMNFLRFQLRVLGHMLDLLHKEPGDGDSHSTQMVPNTNL